MNYTSRIVLLIDMDCFYCQVEENLDPKLKGKPIAVVQYNEWRGGGSDSTITDTPPRKYVKSLDVDFKRLFETPQCTNLSEVTAEQNVAGPSNVLFKTREDVRKPLSPVTETIDTASKTENVNKRIIAVNYPARERGVTRHMRGNDARKKCPEIILAKVPEVRGKADLTKYRDAGKRVADVLQTFTNNLERASVDEAYLDITEVVEKRISDVGCDVTLDKVPNTFVVGSSTADFLENIMISREYNESDFRLLVGGIIAEEIRAEVFKITGYKCSAGIAHNKILAKLVCGMHKPDKQTILPHRAVPELYETLPIKKIKSLGGKFGNAIAEKLGIEHMGELIKFSQKELAKTFDEKAACWLYNIARGIDTEPVTTRLISKSIGCCKKFPGKSALLTREDVEHWLGELAEEISERLEKDLEENNRRPKQMVVSFAQEMNGEDVSGTRTHPLNSYEKNKIFADGLKVIQKNCLRADGTFIITFLGISVGNFQDVKKVKEITSFFKSMRDSEMKKEQDNVKNPGPRDSLPTGNEMNTNGCILKLKDLSSTVTQNAVVDLLSETTYGSPKSESVYSNSTEEDDTQYKDYVYYEQINQNSISDQSFIEYVSYKKNDNVSDSSEDSISKEFNFKDVKAKKAANPPPHSFFTKYFDDNISRNFNASKVLENCNRNDLYMPTVEEDTNDGVDEMASEYSACDKRSLNISDNTLSSMSNKQFKVRENLNEDDCSIGPKNSCPECGKAISYLDYQSHMDYHFAINMVKQEAHLYKPEESKRVPTSPSSSKSTKSQEKQKRKENDGVKSKPINQFFKNTVKDVEAENGQNCSECNKRIRLNDWGVHMDFHAAKKLHLEMNVKKVNSSVSLVSATKVNGQKNIMGFLKRS